MKKFVALVGLIALFALPCLGQTQTISNKVTLSGAPSQQTTTLGLSQAVLNEVLTLAAPQFGFIPSDFIRMFQTCNCIMIEEIGPGTYLVVYGGVGIQIVIDGCRNGGSGQGKPGSRSH